MTNQNQKTNEDKREGDDAFTVAIEKKENSEVLITGEIRWELVNSFRKQAVKKLGENTSVSGFRKGHVPEEILVKKHGEMRLLQEMAQQALAITYPKILIKEKIDAIGRPEISITKIAPENSLGFSIKTAIMPSVELPNYTKIAEEINKNKEAIEIDDKEVDEGINHLREQWAKSEKYQKALKDSGKNEVDPSKIQVEKNDWPELNDEFVKKLGNFTSVENFKNKFKENLESEKKLKSQDKRRIEILEKITGQAKIDVPEILIEGELDKMAQQFQADVTRAGFNLDDYLTKTGKKKEELRKDWRPDAEKRTRHQLVLNNIAVQENIRPDQKRLEEEVEKIKKQYDNVDEARARGYVHMILTNEKVFDFLESVGNTHADK